MAKRIKIISEADAHFISEALLTELGYQPLTDISRNQTIIVPLGRDTKEIRADWVVSVEGKPVIIVEDKRPSETLEDAKDQGLSYARNYNSQFIVPRVIVHNGFTYRVYQTMPEQLLFEFTLTNEHLQKINDKNAKDVIDDIDKINKLNKSNLKNKLTELPEENYKKFDNLRPFTTISEFDSVIQKCANLIYIADEARDEDILDELLKVLFAKLYEEIRISKNNKLDNRFNVKSYMNYLKAVGSELSGEDKDNIISQKIFQEMQESDLMGNLFINEKLHLANDTLTAIVNILQPYCLKDTPVEIKGRVFENLVSKKFKGSRGQYFTPETVVDFIINITNPQPGQKIIDPCCGSGRFLVKGMKEVVEGIQIRYAGEKDVIKEKIEKLKTEDLWGVDIDTKLVRIAKMNMLMAEDGRGHIYQTNSIRPSIWNYLEKESYDLVLTNPPFGNSVIEEITDDFEIEYAKGGRARSQTAFLELFSDLVTEDGKVCTVIDDGILNNPTWSSYRKIIYDNFIIDAVFSLPHNQFNPYNDARSSIIYMHKKNNHEKQDQVFMSIARDLNDPTRTMDEIPFDIIAESYLKYKQNKIKPVNDLCFLCSSDDIDKYDRLDPFFYHPIHSKLNEEFENDDNYYKIKDIMDHAKQQIYTIHPDDNYFQIDNINRDGYIEYITKVGSDLPKGIEYRFPRKAILVSKINAKISCIGMIDRESDYNIKEKEPAPIVSTNEYYGYVNADRKDTPDVKIEYLSLALRTRKFLMQVNRWTSGQYERCKQEDFDELYVYVPSLDIQENIVKDIFKKRATIQELRKYTNDKIFVLEDLSKNESS